MDASNNSKYTTPSGLQLLRGYFLLQRFECSLHLVSPQVSSSPSDKFPSLTAESGRRTSGGRDFYLKVTFCKNYNNCCPQSTFCHHGVGEQLDSRRAQLLPLSINSVNVTPHPKCISLVLRPLGAMISGCQDF